MTAVPRTRDAVIIGGGFYGAVLAVYLVQHKKFRDVVLLEQEDRLLARASYNNQARVHNGYHYPRSFTTAFRSRVNLPKFVRDWPNAVKQDFVSVYAIARRNSRVNARQFRRFCDEIGAKLLPADPAMKRMFNSQLIEDVFLVDEYAFDSRKLAGWAVSELERSGVEVHLRTRGIAVSSTPGDTLEIVTTGTKLPALRARYVFNCTYSGLNNFGGELGGVTTKLKHEITEMALLNVPEALRDVGVTVMDGPYFSLMPFPDKGLHTLSHVRYTPHLSWADARDVNPYHVLQKYPRETRHDRMIRDAARYLPLVGEATYAESLFEIKTVLAKNEGDDGRPILFEKHKDTPGFYSILGGKIDNIYDVLEKIENEII
jgi:glycine/D-amino acid oxidase-like deaminating enzyme